MMKSEVNMTLNSLSNTLNSVHIGTCPKPQGYFLNNLVEI